MSKIIKKQDITVLIESTLKSAGIEPKVDGEKEIVTESEVKEIVIENKKEEKTLINEDFQNEMERFKKLTNYTYKK
jgi:hypothetical protein